MHCSTCRAERADLGRSHGTGRARTALDRTLSPGKGPRPALLSNRGSGPQLISIGVDWVQMDKERQTTILGRAEAQHAARRIGEALQNAVTAEVKAGNLTAYEGAMCAVSAVSSLCMNEGFTKEFFNQFAGEAWALLSRTVQAGKVFLRGPSQS
jgi:hypothetical protein